MKGLFSGRERVPGSGFRRYDAWHRVQYNPKSGFHLCEVRRSRIIVVGMSEFSTVSVNHMETAVWCSSGPGRILLAVLLGLVRFLANHSSDSNPSIR